MEAIPDTVQEDIKLMPDYIATFHKWMQKQGKKDSTSRAYVRVIATLFDEDGKSPASMATKEYFDITKASFKNKMCNGQRSASVKLWIDFWQENGGKSLESSNGVKMYQVNRSMATSSPKPSHLLLSESETEEAKKLRAELELPKEGWTVAIRTRGHTDLIAAVSPGGSAYTTREAVDRRLKRTSSSGSRAQPPEKTPEATEDKSKAKEELKEGANSSKPEIKHESKTSAKQQLEPEAKQDPKKILNTGTTPEIKQPGKTETKIPETKSPPKPPLSPPPDMPSATPKPPAVPPPTAPLGMPPGTPTPPTMPPVGQLEAKPEIKEDEQKPESQKVNSKDEEACAPLNDEQLFMANDAKEDIKEDDNDDFVERMLQGVGELHSQSEDNDERISKKRKTQVILEDPLMTPDVHSETDYPEVDVAEFPATIEVKASKSTKVDGRYDRMKKASRGRPCYTRQAGEKLWYLFWNKKWKIGLEFGCAKSSYAYLKDAAPGVPCEPYPATWRVLDKKDKKNKDDKENKAKEAKIHIKNLAMRLIDGAFLEASLKDEALFGLQGSQHQKTHKTHHDRSSRSKAKSLTHVERLTLKAGDDSSVVTLCEKDTVKDGADAKQDEAQSSDEEKESDSNSSESSSSASLSESDEDQDDSDDEKPARSAPFRPPTKPQSVVNGEKQAEFEAKLRDQLSKVPTPEARLKKFEMVKAMFMKKAQAVEKFGLEPELVEASLRKLHSWILSRGQSGGTTNGEDTPAPLTPPQEPEQSGRQQAHVATSWTAAPLRSVLKKAGAPRNRRRIQISGERQVHIQNFKFCGENLWFQAPGQTVRCDSCDRAVPQTCGSLQGAPSQSQFAQNCFLCGDCSG